LRLKGEELKAEVDFMVFSRLTAKMSLRSWRSRNCMS